MGIAMKALFDATKYMFSADKCAYTSIHQRKHDYNTL